jgi:hypothetical protein
MAMRPSEAHNSVFALYQDNRPLQDVAIAWEGIGRLIPAHAELIKVDSVFRQGTDHPQSPQCGIAGDGGRRSRGFAPSSTVALSSACFR